MPCGVQNGTVGQQINARSRHTGGVNVVMADGSVLAEGTMTVAEVAARLAYSEPSAFFRAFRRWTGTSPRARR